MYGKNIETVGDLKKVLTQYADNTLLVDHFKNGRVEASYFRIEEHEKGIILLNCGHGTLHQ